MKHAEADEPAPSWATLPTEARHPASMGLDRLSGREVVALLLAEDRRGLEAADREAGVIAEAAAWLAAALRSGGDALLVGAGTSGRLGVLEAAECPPTFGIDPARVRAAIAGGTEAVFAAREGAEDREEEGRTAAGQLSARDLLIALSASSVTPFVRGALAEARARGVRSILLTCAGRERAEGAADLVIALDTGPEILTGSTRLKAGSATKAALNAITTAAMVELGKVYENLMVDLRPGSAKLRDRALRILAAAAELAPADAARIHAEAGGETKTAIVMARAGVDAATARSRLARAGGHVRKALALGSILLAVLTAGCNRQAPSPTPPPPAATSVPPLAPKALTPEAETWVEQTLGGMTLRERAAQLVFVRADANFRNRRSAEAQRLLTEVRDLGVGGLVLFASELESIPRLLDELQAAAPVPLLISADLERGLSFRVERGTTPLPYAMAIGATGSEEAARFTGEVTAREAKAAGIHWALAPVVDVNVNPENPAVNVRSYGEDPELVGRLAAAFIAGVRSGGVLTTAKHFPGHGDTATDSHLALPVILADRARFEAVELLPFRRAIAAGVDSIMLGHVAAPALDPSGAPATLSPILSGQLLRREMGFEGLIVTDALEMAGVRPAWGGEAVVRAVAAGADVLLLPKSPRVAIDSLVRAVAEGQLTAARLDESVRRLLRAKARLDLHLTRSTERGALLREVARPEDLARSETTARASITLVRNEGGLLPLHAEAPLELLHIVVASDLNDRLVRGIPEAELAARGVPAETFRLGPKVPREDADEIVRAAAGKTHVLLSIFVRGASFRGTAGMSPSLVELVARLRATGVPLIFLAYGSPYLLAQVPGVPVYLATFGPADSSQRAAIAALFGESPITGKLPVTVAGTYHRGHGIELPKREMTLARAHPASAGFRAEAMADVDATVERYLAARAFPGAVVAVGRKGKLVHLQAYGRLSYEDDAPATRPDTIYDLASLTKVVATTTMAMILVDRGLLDLEKKVSDFLPRFTGGGKEKVTVRHLLTHSSGIDWWAPLYETHADEAAYLETIQQMPLTQEPGKVAKYSDLGVILLGEILERVAGQPLDAFVQENVLLPLGMSSTRFKPPAELLPRIAPTELDPRRGGVVRGVVHDENAFALGGIAPHAGLFGTAEDLARFAQMLLYGGSFEGRRMVSRKTLELFTRRAELPPGSSRALGWDTKSAEGSSAGALFSDRSFGHTGFTGTSLWIDPERELFVILLTNRVFPTRENNLIREARPAVADAVVRGLDAAPPPPRVRVGLERLESEGAAFLAGKRVGLVAHAASVTAEGRHALDVLTALGAKPVRLFSPEHGFRGQAAAGEAVTDGVDATSGLPVVSLYGDHTQPTAEDLAGLDTLVIDLQDAGVRFYTYVSTLLLCLDAAAEAGLEVVVLDRPNPLGGERVEGPTSAPRSVAPASFVNLAPGPLVHGLTLGEMATYANARLKQPARLRVINLEGWSRGMNWADTGRPWVPPSPNLRSPEAALAYPGIALLEATNVSEGRGTETPFLRLGAPWLDPAALALTAPGFALEITDFTPQATTAAPSPKFQGERCRGFALHVTDPAAASPYRLGITLLRALEGQPGFAWRDGGAALTRLLGTPRVFTDLAVGKSVEEILEADTADLRAWREARKPALLYD